MSLMKHISIKDIVIFGCILISLLLFDWICPFQHLTGIPCPGCMMTTALYYLIQFDFETAFYFNPAIYILIVGTVSYFFARNHKKVQKIIVILTIISWLGIYFYRMITIFPNYPMHYVEENRIHQIISMIFRE